MQQELIGLREKEGAASGNFGGCQQALTVAKKECDAAYDEIAKMDTTVTFRQKTPFVKKYTEKKSAQIQAAAAFETAEGNLNNARGAVNEATARLQAAQGADAKANERLQEAEEE